MSIDFFDDDAGLCRFCNARNDIFEEVKVDKFQQTESRIKLSSLKAQQEKQKQTAQQEYSALRERIRKHTRKTLPRLDNYLTSPTLIDATTPRQMRIIPGRCVYCGTKLRKPNNYGVKCSYCKRRDGDYR